MRLKPIHAGILFAAAAVIAFVAWWWSRDTVPAAPTEMAMPAPDAQGRIRLSAAQVRSLGIRTAPAAAASVSRIAGLPATAAAPLAASTQVVVPYAGAITRVLVDEGETVRARQPMLRVQSRDVIGIRAELARARAEAGVAGQQARRDALLVAEGIVPAARRSESAARAAAARASVDEAAAMLANLRQPPGALPGEYEILAPRQGLVLRRAVAPGDAVDAMAPAFALSGMDALDIQFTAPIALRDRLMPGVGVVLPGGGRARVVAVGADADAATQSLRVRARSEGAVPLLPGQQFEVALEVPAPAGAVVVPASALLAHGEAFVVYVRDGDAYRGIVVQRLGGEERTAVVVGDGLRAGMPVVAAGSSVLRTLAPVGE